MASLIAVASSVAVFGLLPASVAPLVPSVLTTASRTVAPPRMGLGSFMGRFRKKKEVVAAPQIEVHRASLQPAALDVSLLSFCAMSQVGEAIPDVDVQVLPPLPATTADEDDEEAGLLPEVKVCTAAEALPGKSLLIGMPGAFTPTCTDEHLPGYMRSAAKLAEYGVERIAIVTTNDHYTNKEWRTKLIQCEGPGSWPDNMDLISDGDGDFVKALGLCDDMGFGIGERSKRFSLLCTDGVVEHVAVDDGMRELDATAAEVFVKMLAPPPPTAPSGMSEEDATNVAAVGALALIAALAVYYGYGDPSGLQVVP
jgi:peroxiredoxin